MTKSKDRPPCPVCTQDFGRNGRPVNRHRPDIRLTTAYVSKIGSDCADIAVLLDLAASKVLDKHLARDLALACDKLLQMKELFQ